MTYFYRNVKVLMQFLFQRLTIFIFLSQKVPTSIFSRGTGFCIWKSK